MNYNLATHDEYLIRPRLLSKFAKIKTVRRAEDFFGYRAEFQQSKGVRAEF